MSGIFHLPIGSTTPKQGDKDYRIRFFDWDGTLLKTQWVYDSVDPSPPTTPNHPNLSFYGWNIDYITPTRNMDCGAIYTSVDSYINITLATGTAKTITIYLSKVDATNTVIYWGDGTSNTLSTAGNVSATRTYTDYGDYEIRIESVGYFFMGQGASLLGMFQNNMNQCVKSVIMGEKAVVAQYGFYNFTSMEKVIMSLNGTSIDHAFRGCWSLKHVNIPTAYTNIQTYAFNNNFALKNVILNDAITAIGTYAFYNCYNLESIILPSSITSFGVYAFSEARSLKEINVQSSAANIPSNFLQNAYTLKSIDFPDTISSFSSGPFPACYGLEEAIFRRTTPPTLADTTTFQTYSTNKKLFKIYVPDASVTAYKSATNWSPYANYIYPISERP